MRATVQITETQAARLLARLRQLYGAAEYDPDVDITVAQAAAALNVKPNQARLYLEQEVQEQRMVKRSTVLNGKRVNVYRDSPVVMSIGDTEST